MTWGLEHLNNLLGNQTVADATHAAAEAAWEYAEQNPLTAAIATTATVLTIAAATVMTCRGCRKSAGSSDSPEPEADSDEKKKKKKKAQ